MNLTVLTPDNEIFQGEVSSVKVPGVEGQFEVRNNHAPVVAALTEGNVRLIKADSNKMTFKIHKGFIEVLNNEIALLVQGVTDIAE